MNREDLHDSLQDVLSKRPFDIKTKADVVNTGNHPKMTNHIKEKLSNKERFLAKVLINGERLWCIVIGMSYEEGDTFVGVLDNDPVSDELSFNDMIEFQSCDVFELDELR